MYTGLTVQRFIKLKIVLVYKTFVKNLLLVRVLVDDTFVVVDDLFVVDVVAKFLKFKIELESQSLSARFLPQLNFCMLRVKS